MAELRVEPLDELDRRRKMRREASAEANLYLHNIRDILVLWA